MIQAAQFPSVVATLLLLQCVTLAQHASDDRLDVAATTWEIDDSLCCPLPRIWVGAEYVHWWTSGDTIPALVTTSLTDTLSTEAGRLGLPSTSILVGDQTIHDGSRSGTKLTLGGWLDLERSVGFELNYATLANNEAHFSANPNTAILARPFYDVLLDQQEAKLVRFPDAARGDLDISLANKFCTGQALMRLAFMQAPDFQFDGWLGYRIAGLDDAIHISEQSEVLSGPAVGTQFTLSDQFRTHNTFHGVDLGVRYRECLQGYWSVELLGHLALGTTRTRTDIVGQTLTRLGQESTLSSAGLLAQPTNMGTWIDDEFSTVTELGFQLRRPFGYGLSATMGYSFLSWRGVTRAGDQVDMSINTSQVPPGELNGPARPRVDPSDDEFWAHGLRVGVEYVF